MVFFVQNSPSHPPSPLRAVRICSHSIDLREEIEKVRITLLLNKYPPKFIDRHFQRFFETLTNQKDPKLLLSENYNEFRNKVLDTQWNKKEKQQINFNKDILLHFTYTPSLAQFGAKFHVLWKEIFEETPLSDISVIFAHRLADNLKKILVHKKPSKTVIKNIIDQIEE